MRANGDTEIDGNLDVVGDNACDTCHGSGGVAAPPLDLGGKRVPDQVIVGGGLAGFAVVSLIILVIAW